jgi:hypothetical protein
MGTVSRRADCQDLSWKIGQIIFFSIEGITLGADEEIYIRLLEEQVAWVWID